MDESSTPGERLFRVKPGDKAVFSALCTIYHEAIPASERKPDTVLEQLLSRPDYVVCCLELDGTVAGFAILYCSANEPLALLEYMAVDKSMRNGGMGGRILDRLFTPEFLGEERFCMVEVDAPGPAHADSEIRTRRQGFYRRHGCLLLKDFSYILPLPFTGEPPDMQLMFRPPAGKKVPSREELEAWLKDVYVRVYGCRSDDDRIGLMMNRYRGDPVLI